MNKKFISMATGVLAILGIGMSTAQASPVFSEKTESIVNVTAETPVFLEQPSFTASGDRLLACHYSHSSHSSHSSHYSHYSSRY
jgi:hypothetical protein